MPQANQLLFVQIIENTFAKTLLIKKIVEKTFIEKLPRLSQVNTRSQTLIWTVHHTPHTTWMARDHRQETEEEAEARDWDKFVATHRQLALQHQLIKIRIKDKTKACSVVETKARCQAIEDDNEAWD